MITWSVSFTIACARWSTVQYLQRSKGTDERVSDNRAWNRGVCDTRRACAHKGRLTEYHFATLYKGGTSLLRARKLTLRIFLSFQGESLWHLLFSSQLHNVPTFRVSDQMRVPIKLHTPSIGMQQWIVCGLVLVRRMDADEKKRAIVWVRCAPRTAG
jgi:hypothetical protein